MGEDKLTNNPISDLRSYVLGGGKLVLLISRDLLRLEGACIAIARESGRPLFKWDEQAKKGTKLLPGGEWSDEFEDHKETNISDKENLYRHLYNSSSDMICWIPLEAPLLNHDGGEGSRDEVLLGTNLAIAKWALTKEEVSVHGDEDASTDKTWKGKTLIISGFSESLPEELREVTHKIRWNYPSREEIYRLITGREASFEDGEYNHLTEDVDENCILQLVGYQEAFQLNELSESWSLGVTVDSMVKASQGLDLQDCEIAINSAIREFKQTGVNDIIKAIQRQKVRILAQDGLLAVENTDEREIKGLENLQIWVKNKSEQFNNPSLAAKHGIKPLKGLLLTGVPGCGKSMSAKSIAKNLKVPLLSFDLGKLMNKYVGASEDNMHRALSQAEGMSPCVLWIDEFEKMFSSASNGQQSHEVSQRLNAIFLKWMEEKKHDVFVIATSNDLSTIKAEYQRTGRWDSTFFFDLPSKNERLEILKSTLTDYEDTGGNNLTEQEYENIVTQTQGWASSDLAGLTKAAKTNAFENWNISQDGELSVISYADYLHIIKEDMITPMQKRSPERLNQIRREGKAYTNASKYAEDDVEVPLLEIQIEVNKNDS